MARISLANALTGIRNAVGANGQLRAKEQLSAAVDALLQLVGNANIAPGNTELGDPLSNPFTVFVDPINGSDRFAAGVYNAFAEPENATPEAKTVARLRRIALQQMTCGYSRHRPFRTINRAAIELAVATSREWFTADEQAWQQPTMVLLPGQHIAYNDPGNSPQAIPVSEWTEGLEPTPQQLIAFNPDRGGIVLPRSPAVIGTPGKTIVRPSYVPAAADEAADWSNRSAILLFCGSVSGITFADKVGASSSHHLLDPWRSVSEGDLDQFYAVVRQALGAPANLSSALAVARAAEWQQGVSGTPAESWDQPPQPARADSCHIHSHWGMGSLFWAGSGTFEGEITSDTMQRDLSCWQIYAEGSWRAPSTYEELLASHPDDLRMHPRRLSRHITAVENTRVCLSRSDAVGAGRHLVAAGGACIETTGSTSRFGGCVAVAQGYHGSAAPIDSEWSILRIKAARDVADLRGNVTRIPLGVVAAISSSTITLQEPLESGDSLSVPQVLAEQGFSLPMGSLIWIENPNGPDWQTALGASAWSSAAAAQIQTTGLPVEAGTGMAIGAANGVSLAIGATVYVRRLLDTRTSAERRICLVLTNSTSARLPVRHSILQTRPGGSGIARALLPGGAEVLAVNHSCRIPPGAGMQIAAEVTLRRCCPDEIWEPNRFYREGDTVKHAGKHFTATKNHYSTGSAPSAQWQQSYVQQASTFNAEDSPHNEAPILIFDIDTDSTTDASVTCGINWATIFMSAGSVRDQLRSATDYRGALALLQALGFPSAGEAWDAHAALRPRTETARELDPTSAADFPTAPSGGAASERAYWGVEFRQPSIVALRAHAVDAVGHWNRSRALLPARRAMSPLNQHDACFAADQGGRVEIRAVNGEGFEVTNQGLINLDTGKVVPRPRISADQ